VVAGREARRSNGVGKLALSAPDLLMSSDRPPPPADWPLLSMTEGPDLRLFRVIHERRRNPRNGHELDALRLESPDWVNVVPVTADGHLLLVRQFRFGVRSSTLEIPGGMVHRGEDPAVAAARELREETGHVARRLVALPPVEPNPAFLGNLCHQYLAEDVQPCGGLDQDPGEDLVVERHSLDAVRAMVASGVIRHSLVLTALCRILDLRR
jgi:8-oxo-dGTP pyrophosphatase MutT (NUDIX family)